MKIILLQDIYKHGVAGEIVTVADGFARNYLIPRGMARKATQGALKSHKKLLEQVETRRAAYDNMLNDLARQIDGTELLFERRASPTGTLYGSVTTQEIADSLMEATGVDINRRRISQQALREIGKFEVPVRLGNEISPVLNIVIIREGTMEEFLAARKAAEAGEEVDPAALGEPSNELPEPILSAAEMNGEETNVIQKSALEQAIDSAAEESGIETDDEVAE